jgi:uncharacterized protein YifE (UPF0438 family)
MMKAALKVIRIAEQQGQPGLSKAQKLFNKLINKIDKERKLLGAWQATIPRFAQKYANELDPRRQTFNDLRTELVCLLDKVYSEKVFNKRDREKIKHVICAIAEELMAVNDNEALKRIYNKYGDIDFDAKAEEEKEALRFMMEDILEIDLGDDIDYSSPEAMMSQVADKMQQKLAEEEQAQQKYRERMGKRKKSAKTLAKEARQQAEAQNISQSVRDVYRKLASALHPDKEQDAVERSRKTDLMQRVNVAYSNRDLLQLLELQLEVEQIDQTTINAITADRLKYYNTILAEQSAELRQEVIAVELSFRMRFNIRPEVALSPAEAMRALEIDIHHIKQGISSLKNDLAAFQDIRNIKDWLKSYRVTPQPSFEDDPFEVWT